MHLHQHGETQGTSHLEQVGHVRIGEDGGNQQRSIGASRPGLIQLIGTQDEVFTEQRQIHNLAHLHQHLEAALEKLFIREHREAARPAGCVAAGNRLGIEILADHPFAGAGFLHLSDHRRFAAGRFECRKKIARGRELSNLLLELIEADALAGDGHLTIFLPHDLLEDVARFALLVGNGVFEVRHLHLGIGRPATDLHGFRLPRPWRPACTPLPPLRSGWGGCAPHWPVASRSGGGPRRSRSPESDPPHAGHRYGHRAPHQCSC